MEEPTDEMLHAIMEKVAIAARESSARVAKIHRQRLAEIMARKAGKIATAKWVKYVVQHEEMTDGEENWN